MQRLELAVPQVQLAGRDGGFSVDNVQGVNEVKWIKG
jgi:hypothetical protein